MGIKLNQNQSLKIPQKQVFFFQIILQSALHLYQILKTILKIFTSNYQLTHYPFFPLIGISIIKQIFIQAQIQVLSFPAKFQQMQGFGIFQLPRSFYGLNDYYYLFSNYNDLNVQMNAKYQKLSQCSSQQNFSIPYYQPLSPFHKITTPHRARINTSTPSIQTSPINFLSAINKDKSPNEKENQGISLNQSPISAKFNSRQADILNEKRKSPIPKMTKQLNSRVSHHAYHKSESIQPAEQRFENENIHCQNFEESLRSLAIKSPQNCFQNQPKSKPNNFKGILQAQEYEIKQKCFQKKRPQDSLLKKSSSVRQYDEKLFSSCFQNTDKRNIPQPLQNKSYESLLCMNDDGNTAKYITIATQQGDERLYYCSKCTVLLVNQGFILEQISNREIENEKNNQRLQRSDLQDKTQMCKDKLSSLINDLTMRQQFEISKLGQYYDGLLNAIENCRKRNQANLKTIYRQKIQDYESILMEIDCFGKTIELTQQNINQFQSLQSQILKFNLGDPILKMYDTESLVKLQESFCQMVQQNYKLVSSSKANHHKQQQHQRSKQGGINRNHGLRFSFEKLLSDINTKKCKMQNIMSSLQEEEEDDSQVEREGKQRTAFRDLFPEAQDSSQINSGVNSPTFKHF